MTVQLAPQHKVGLSPQRPLLLAGCTPELLALYDPSLLGAVVAPELGGRERRAVRVLERPGGCLIEETRGVFSFSALHRLLQDAGDLPVIGQVLGAEAVPAARAAERLAREGVQAVLVDLVPDAPQRVCAVLQAIRTAVDLPLLAQLPFEDALDYALACADLADSLVVSAPPRGLFPSPTRGEGGGEGRAQQETELLLVQQSPLPLPSPPWGEREGAAACPPLNPAKGRENHSNKHHEFLPVRVHGPLLLPLTLRCLQQIAAAVDLPLIARGGIFTPNDALAALASGATAVMVDTLAFVDPAAVEAIAQAL